MFLTAQNHHIRNETGLAPLGVYGQTKAAGDLLALLYQSIHSQDPAGSSAWVKTLSKLWQN